MVLDAGRIFYCGENNSVVFLSKFFKGVLDGLWLVAGDAHVNRLRLGCDEGSEFEHGIDSLLGFKCFHVFAQKASVVVFAKYVLYDLLSE